MGKRHPNPKLVKIHRSYSVEQIATLFGVHRNTVRNWVKQGLQTIDKRKPMIIRGPDLVAYVQNLRTKNKRTCQPGEMYCVGCRAPRRPAGNMAEYKASTATLGALVGICPSCDTLMYRRVSFTKLVQVSGNLDVTPPQAVSRIGESPFPFLNCDLKQGANHHDNAQR